MTGIRKETKQRDKEIYDAYINGVPVNVIAQTLKAAKGNIYNSMKRHLDPDGFKKKETEYEIKSIRKDPCRVYKPKRVKL